jgi:hypothetical protein
MHHHFTADPVWLREYSNDINFHNARYIFNKGTTLMSLTFKLKVHGGGSKLADDPNSVHISLEEFRNLGLQLPKNSRACKSEASYQGAFISSNERDT